MFKKDLNVKDGCWVFCLGEVMKNFIFVNIFWLVGKYKKVGFYIGYVVEVLVKVV